MLLSSSEPTLYGSTNKVCQDSIWDTGFYSATDCTGKVFVLRRPNIGPSLNADNSSNLNFPMSFSEIRLYQTPNLISALVGTVKINAISRAGKGAWGSLQKLIDTPKVISMKFGELPKTGSGTTGEE